MESSNRNIFEEIKGAAASARWECNYNEKIGNITFTKDMKKYDEYSFIVSLDNEEGPEILSSVQDAINAEADSINSQDFVNEMMYRDEQMDRNDGRAYDYANRLLNAIHGLENQMQCLAEKLETVFCDGTSLQPLDDAISKAEQIREAQANAEGRTHQKDGKGEEK